MSIDGILFDGQRAKIKKFQSFLLWKRWFALPLCLVAGIFQALGSIFNNPVSITMILLIAKPVDNFRRWRALKRGELYSSFFD